MREKEVVMLAEVIEIQAQIIREQAQLLERLGVDAPALESKQKEIEKAAQFLCGI